MVMSERRVRALATPVINGPVVGASGSLVLNVQPILAITRGEERGCVGARGNGLTQGAGSILDLLLVSSRRPETRGPAGLLICAGAWPGVREAEGDREMALGLVGAPSPTVHRLSLLTPTGKPRGWSRQDSSCKGGVGGRPQMGGQQGFKVGHRAERAKITRKRYAWMVTSHVPGDGRYRGGSDAELGFH